MRWATRHGHCQPHCSFPAGTHSRDPVRFPVSNPGIFSVQSLELVDAHVWFVRFALSPEGGVLACGTHAGDVLLWDPHELRAQPRTRLGRPPCRGLRAPTVRRQSDPKVFGRLCISAGGSVVSA